MTFLNVNLARVRAGRLTKLLATVFCAVGCGAADASSDPSALGQASSALPTQESSINQCTTGLTKCGGTCVDLSSDEAHCGSCKTVCASGDSCRVGRCTPPGKAVMIVRVRVINDNGGTKAASDVTFAVSAVRTSVFGLLGDPTTFQGSTDGTPVVVWPGPQFFSLVSFPGYFINFSAGCTTPVSAGEIRPCEITLTDE